MASTEDLLALALESDRRPAEAASVARACLAVAALDDEPGSYLARYARDITPGARG